MPEEQRCYTFKCPYCDNPQLHILYTARLEYALPVTKLAEGDVRRDKINRHPIYESSGSRNGYICVRCGHRWDSLASLNEGGALTKFDN